MARHLDLEDASLDGYRTVIENRHDYIIVCSELLIKSRIILKPTYTVCRLPISREKR